jgi:hypothetical protein
MSDSVPNAPLADEPLLVGRLNWEIAYHIIPGTIFGEISEEDLEQCLTFPKWGMFLYFQHCKARGFMPDRTIVEQYRSHHGMLDANWNYTIIEYPPPISPLKEATMLLPHFSAILRCVDDPRGLRYYVMAQSLRPEGTTIRTVTADGIHASDGRGPEPELPLFLDALRERTARDDA